MSFKKEKISFVNMVNNKGPSIGLYGTPDVIFLQFPRILFFTALVAILITGKKLIFAIND